MPPSVASRTSEFRNIPPPDREADVLRGSIAILRDRLPATWTAEIRAEPAPASDAGVDAELRLMAPDGTEAVVLVQAKRLLNTRDVPVAPAAEVLLLMAPDGTEAVVLVQAKRLLNTRDVPVALEALQQAAARRSGDEEVVVLLTSRYLAPATRERIASAGAGYIDVTGNLLVTVGQPALFLRDRGADRDPWRGPGRPRDTLRGPPAARVVRALIDFAPPYTVPEISERSGASTGATYRVVADRESHGF